MAQVFSKLNYWYKYPKRVRILFEECDTDNDGYLCFDDVRRMLVLFKIYKDDHQVDIMMDSLGADGTRRLDILQFYRIYKAYKKRKRAEPRTMTESLVFSVFDRNDDGLITLT
ncbi:hypothetical protein ACOME3_001225 [Neoechinorhynchus agilis]